LRFAVVGPGRVGSSLALWLRRAGGELAGWSARRPGRRVAGFPRRLETSVAGLSQATLDLLLVCVPDAALPDLARQLGAVRSAVVLHVSGASSCEVLAPLRGAGGRRGRPVAVGSFHPLWPFAQVERRAPPGLVFGIDGDPGALRLARRLARVWGASTALVPAADRQLYHLAASIAAGGVATVAASAAALTRALGLPAGLGEGFRALAAGAIQALEGPRLDRGFTGPVARGEPALVAEQWQLLAERAPEFVPLVHVLAQALVARLAETGAATRSHRQIADGAGLPQGLSGARAGNAATTRRPPFS
jgi:predicted short-subunit dehydrogenase-like oxidoreductase (DUF2520 family)